MHKQLLTIFLILVFKAITAQGSVSDTATNMPMVQINYGFQLPGNDLADRYGMNHTVGASFMYKTHKNWLFRGTFNYLFSENIKNKEDILSGIATGDGHIIDGNGMLTEVNFHQRGFVSNISAGKLFPVIGPNKNSGLFFIGGAGLLQHKTLIQNPENKAPQISGEYRKGYDRLTNGLAVNEFIGYMHIGKGKASNFYIGIEMIQAWTQSRRDYNFNKMKKVTDKRFDTLWGLKIGWILPISGKTSGEYHYF
ncbi:MAG: hypothetical protein ACOCPM_02250 [Bacteroidales bacterium]